MRLHLAADSFSIFPPGPHQFGSSFHGHQWESVIFTSDAFPSFHHHQEDAILELFAGNNGILNTPTGSGKSLVALALQFKSLGHVLGPENVGMITGDATSYGPRNSFRLLVSSRASEDETSSLPVRRIHR